MGMIQLLLKGFDVRLHAKLHPPHCGQGHDGAASVFFTHGKTGEKLPERKLVQKYLLSPLSASAIDRT
jgi:hypothetical protein